MDQVRLDIVHSNVGILAENDLEMAAEFNAHIFTFNTPIPPRIQELAKQKNVHIEEFHVIYKLVERLKVNLK
jgi:translation initiation factor IF-2